jgi:vacuolar-type H+-ATPase subunit E/Vma4
MSLDRLIEEIRSRGEADLAAAERRAEEEKARIAKDRDARTEEIRSRLARQGETEARRLRAQKIAGARMQARKLEYEAQERALAGSLEAVRGLLQEYTRSGEYPEALGRMYAFAVDRLGKDVRVAGRAEDASLLKGIAGKAFNPAPLPILGGLVAETPDGARRLTLTLDELLRLHEDRARELVA